MDISKIFKLAIKDNRSFEEALEVVKANSRGFVYLIGGFLYRNIAHELYGTPKPEMDMDFIVEERQPEIRLPLGWGLQKNRFGNPKMTSSRGNIDIVPIHTVYQIETRGLEPTIWNFLAGTPLTNQAIAYDVNEGIVIGDSGIRALLDKTVGINDMDSIRNVAKKEEVTTDDYIAEKAKSLGFTPVFSPL